MRASTRGRTLWVCMGALWWSGASAADPAASAGDCFTAGFEANNADAVAACYAEDAIIWFPGGPMAKGRAAIRDGFAGYLAGVVIKDDGLILSNLHVVAGARRITVVFADGTESPATLTGARPEHG